MIALKRVFVELPNGSLGHISIFRKHNGNIYYVFFIEERYVGFKEISNDGFLTVDKGGVMPFESYRVFRCIDYTQKDNHIGTI